MEGEKKGKDDGKSPKKPEAKEEGAQGGQTGGAIDALAAGLSNYFSSAVKLDDVEKVLSEVSFEGVAKYLKSDKCTNIITMAGAGISTSAGIPDFRSPGSGLYDNLQKYNLPDPMAIFNIQYFTENPEPFCHLAKELWPGHFKPTPCHYFVKQLHDKGKLLRHYTQNIDTLEHYTGLPADKIVEAHGTFRTSHCLKCAKEFSQDWIKEKIFAEETPTCDAEGCAGLVKPDIVFFGEKLPDRFFSCVKEDFGKCDLLIILGTSLSVQPFASLTGRVPTKTPRLYINLDKGNTDVDPFMMLLMGGGSTLNFDEEGNYRDVFKKATCDEGCYSLSELVGWGKDLRKTVESEHKRLDAEIATDKQKTNPTKGASK
ncbi:NAD-dependent protein deacetylase sirtuin-2-like [Haliotis rufescens]|uniref:NAD-dependent protein deacetylase sirtuin-2-like n=1 Tax=Haliotis rufescens TaxID=6454 RepID=UPI00201F576C|nr:NAD-dependent protein deacetylase sirtuin-2-like [Haliotis rufescens]XP_046333320.2 NAD-dependent protein deacetylase sirtuin-2-like [Haliotis rufescens]